MKSLIFAAFVASLVSFELFTLRRKMGERLFFERLTIIIPVAVVELVILCLIGKYFVF